MVYWSIVEQVLIRHKGKTKQGSLWFDFLNQKYKVRVKDKKEYFYQYLGSPFEKLDKEKILKEFENNQRIEFIGVRNVEKIRK